VAAGQPQPGTSARNMSGCEVQRGFYARLHASPQPKSGRGRVELGTLAQDVWKAKGRQREVGGGKVV
jgi:hypothetical protein